MGPESVSQRISESRSGCEKGTSTIVTKNQTPDVEYETEEDEMETFEQLVQILHETSKKPTKTRKTSKHASSYAISGNQMLVLEEPIFPTNALLDQKDALLAQILQHSMNNTPFPTSLISAVSHYNQSAQGFSGSVPPPASYSPQPTFGPIPPSPFLPLPTLTTTTQSSGPPPLFTTPPSFPISTIPPPPPPPFAPDYFSVFEIMLKQLEDDLGITIGALTNKLNATLDKFEVSHPTKSMSWKVWASEKTAWLHFYANHAKKNMFPGIKPAF